MKTIEEIELEIIEEFATFEDVFDKFGYLIDIGKKLQPMDASLKTDERKIKGCQANVWLYSEFRNGKIFFRADADAGYARGLVAMMIRVLSGHSPDEIINAKLNFLETVGFDKWLSMKRANGLASMIKQMKLDALAFKMKK